MKSSIVLIGFMGVGKSAVGRVLAKELDKQFIELDALIERMVGKSIPEIFAQEGETAFREYEINAIKEIAAGKGQVIACGGGVVLNRINIDRLQKEAVIILLSASPEIIARRVSGSKAARPLLQNTAVPAVQKILKFRQPFYDRAADYKIDTSGLDISSVVRKIITRLKKNEDFCW